MEAVCQGKQWDVALAYNDDGGVAAAMPYLIGKRLGMRYILQPQLTQYSGPWYNYDAAGMSEYDRISFEQQTTEKLIDAFDNLHIAVFRQRFSPQITNWLPFYQHGFRQTTRYTYRIDDISDTQRVFSMLTAHRRKKINQWDSQLSFDLLQADDAAWFADFHTDYWQSKGQRNLLPHSFIERVVSTSLRRNSGVVMRLKNSAGDVLAAAFAVYDSQSAYLLQSALSPSLHRNGHKETLLWKLIVWLSSRTKSFDFEGSMVEGIEYFNRSFATRQVPFFQVERYANPLLEWYMRRK
jgi:hypothetical protein